MQFVTAGSLYLLLLSLNLVVGQGGDDGVCTFDLQDKCARCAFWGDNDGGPTKKYNCSLPGLEDFAPGGQYEGVQANYLSYLTETSTPFFPDRAKEFEACTGGRIVFADAPDVFQDPVADLGTRIDRGSEVYDGYFMSYSHFPEVSALKLAEPLNDRIRQDNARLKWEDVLPKVKAMGEYRHVNGEKALEFLMYDGDFFVPVIRLDLLEKHNLPLPNSWEEVVEYVKLFNGTDLNDDGDPNDFGFCHFPRKGAGSWDDWWAEALYATWATVDQELGTSQGFFFDSETMEPRIAGGYRYASEIWKELWTRGYSSETDAFLEGRCAVGFAPPGSWKRLFLTPNGVHRADANGTVVWQPKLKNGEYAEPYRFKPFGSTKVIDRTTGEWKDCTLDICPKAEPVPAKGHLSDDDRASVLPPSPLEGQLMNRAPFYWSGGLGTLIRKSAPKVRKDLLWDFFVYTNSPQTSVYDVANYRSWLDSWRYSQLTPGDNFREAGWSEDAYQEHNAVMLWALSKESNGAFNLRLPSAVRYTSEVAGEMTRKYFFGEMTTDELLTQVDQGWRRITEDIGKLEQLTVYRSSLGLEQLPEVDLCRLHRELMDERDPSVCRKYDDKNEARVFKAVLIPVGVLFIALLALVYYERKRKSTDLVWNIEAAELHFEDPPKVLGKGTFGYVLKAEYRGTEVAVKRFLQDPSSILRTGSPTKRSSRGQAEESQILRSFAQRASVGPEGAAALISKTAVTPAAMGQTMTARESRAMVDMVKSHASGGKGGGRESTPGGWLRRAFKTDKEYEKQRTEFVEEIKKLASLRHQCVITIMGAVLARTDSMIVLEYMDHGSLYDVLHNETIEMKGEIILPVLRDIAQGIRFLHAATPQIIHCDLKASNILVDGRFRAKVADFGLSKMDSSKAGAAGTPYFLAPEILRGETGNTVESDAYAFGMVIFEVYSRKDPYEGEKPLEVLCQVANKAVMKRPPPPPTAPPKAQALMMECLVDDPKQRPTFEELGLQLKRLDIATMEPVQRSYPIKPEQAVHVYDKFPKDIAEALRRGRKVEPRSRESCSIFSSQICDFEQLASCLPPMKLADLMHRLYSKFDNLCSNFDVYKVDTITDSYMAITGLIQDQPDHAKRIAEFAIAAVQASKETLVDEEDPSMGCVNIRVGVASGSVVANVVGTIHPRFSLFGDAVTTSSRMEQSSVKGFIQCSEVSAMFLEEQAPHIQIHPRGLMNIKGKGEMFTFFVNKEPGALDVVQEEGEEGEDNE